MREERKSQRDSYAEKREKYFDTVVSMFAQGMTASEISSVVPISRSTVHRWIDEYNDRQKGQPSEIFNVRKSPQAAVRMLTGMKQRIAQLEAQIEAHDNQIEFENRESVKFARLAKAPKLKLTVVKTRPNKDGTYEIKISVCTKSQTAYILTGYFIRNLSEWDNGIVVGRPDADKLNGKLEQVLSMYRNLANSLPADIDAKEAKRQLEEKGGSLLQEEDVKAEMETMRIELLDELKYFATVTKRLTTQIETAIHRLTK